jgi:hypothetical protein
LCTLRRTGCFRQVTKNSITLLFNESLLSAGNDAVTVFDPVDRIPLEGLIGSGSHPQGNKDFVGRCDMLPNGTANPWCSSFGSVSPLEVEYTITGPNGTVSTWLPISLATQRGPFFNENCQVLSDLLLIYRVILCRAGVVGWSPRACNVDICSQINPKHPSTPPCVNGSRKANWASAKAPAGPMPKGGDLNLTQVVTGIRYAWRLGCCPTGQSVCPPNSCPIRGWNSTLPAPGFFARVVNGRCKCIPPQKCDA